MLRFFDIILSFFGLILLLPLFFVIFIFSIFDTGSPIFIQTRMGRAKKPFRLIKFRTMGINTASVASHLVDASEVTRFGRFLRTTKLDELPQLINVLKGDMSLVGPRPNLSNQDQLIHEREKLGIYNIRPGITGLAQIENVDMSTPLLLAQKDSMMINNLSLKTYFMYIFLTVSGKGSGDAIN